MNIYELTGVALELQQLLESGEIDPQTYQDTLEGLDIETKIENICYVYRNLEAQAEAFKKEKDRLAEREKVANNGVKRLKESLLYHLQATDQKNIKAGLFSVYRGVSQSVNITDESSIPEDYLIYQPAKIDKKGLAKALKENEMIIGAELVETEYIRIR